MESLRPLSHPDDKATGQEGETKKKRAWPRVGPDEKISETKEPEPSVEAPAESTDAAPEAVVLENY
jgi:hypothetical protein